jgi:hypothetical protein
MERNLDYLLNFDENALSNLKRYFSKKVKAQSFFQPSFFLSFYSYLYPIPIGNLLDRLQYINQKAVLTESNYNF